MEEFYYYIFEDKKPVAVDLETYAKWVGKERVLVRDNHDIWLGEVAWTSVGDVVISTVFLGMDHSFGMGGPPILFETMVFGGLLDKEQERYSTREEAKAGHKAMVERVLGKVS